MQKNTILLENAIYVGDVFHERHDPFSHKLRYKVFSYWLDIDDLENLSRDLKYFSFNRFGVTGIKNKDHAARDGSDLRAWIEAAARQKNIDIDPGQGRIFMLCFPRMWGYVFSPLTVFFCFDRDGVLKAALHQVKNTFGEQHAYMLAVENPDGIIAQECGKDFHVSPFIHMDCNYQFRFARPSDTLNFAIHQFQGEDYGNKKILTATWTGRRLTFTDKNILKCVMKHPLMTLKVIAGIHLEAFHLVRKGAKYIRRPIKTSPDIT